MYTGNWLNSHVRHKIRGKGLKVAKVRWRFDIILNNSILEVSTFISVQIMN